MALHAFHHLQLPLTSLFPSPPLSPRLRLRLRLSAPLIFKPLPLTPIGISSLPRRRRMTVTGVVEESQESSESKSEAESESESKESELASELKKAMEEKKEKEGDNFWNGVAQEISEIEWPAFGKVLGTTGVVLSVILGSSVVLLTVNAVLAELSDRVFSGKGVQDFFT
ncbi:preprotein translocase subunit SECE1 [Gastrolobium bilobum]|uniref:preprotein translocase subunit SECE1 n=1 Tax=Gastrolobium bilobum TaxID=150636 RepID=UPI002AB192CD|nr:preprotein translocase subunit SECE1 [Gastrolobium bilobum]